MNFKILKKTKRGFTLIELVIVIAILAILVAIAIPRFSKSNLSAQAAAHNANVREIKSVVTLYLIEEDTMPSSVSIDDLKDYFDNEVPVPAKSLEEYSQFTIEIDNGDINVTPGTVKVENNKLVIE